MLCGCPAFEFRLPRMTVFFMTTTPDSEQTPQPVRETWKYCPRCGNAPQQIGENPFQCEACGHRHFFGPVSAVAGIITDAAGRILVLIRNRDPGRGLFGIPGGFCDPGETAEQSLAREIREEVGLEATAMKYLGSFPNEYVYRGAILPVTDLFFTAEVSSTQGICLQQEEICDYQFCAPQDLQLEQFAFQSNRRALELFLEQTSATMG